MTHPQLLQAIAVFILATSNLYSKDYTLIQQLPATLRNIHMECHKGWGGPNTPEGWDSGNTPAMKEATDHYNDALIGLIAKLVKTYYPNKWIEENQIKNYISGLYAVHDFEQLAHNPTGEYQGTIAMLDAPAHVSSDLETMVCDMVKAITSDDSRFSYKAWKKRWDQATKAGD